jgi:hypothetical protein
MLERTTIKELALCLAMILVIVGSFFCLLVFLHYILRG